MIEKAAIDFFGILGDMSPKEHRTIQRDADDQYYTEGEGRKQIHREEVQQFVKWLKEHTSTTDCYQEDGSVAYCKGDAVITTATIQSLLQQAEGK